MIFLFCCYLRETVCDFLGGLSEVDRRLCAECSSAVNSKRPSEVTGGLQAKRKKKLKVSDFCKNGCKSDKGVLKFSGGIT